MSDLFAKAGPDAGAPLAEQLRPYFADLTDHPCLPNVPALSPTTAPVDPQFQTVFLQRLRDIFAAANIAIGTVTYEATAAPVEGASCSKRMP